MKFLELIKHPDLLKILEGFQETEQKKKQVGFNLLTASSYTSHLENFHSDIIAALLNPKGLHGEGSLFLELLIDFLNKNYHTKIDKSNFRNAIVTREKGRIDIWIRDEVSKCAIIIENKINNASDTANQLDNYYNFSTDKEYDVCCIIYLSLGGYKTAPNAENNEVNKLVKNIPAYSKTLPDLYNGWLLKSLTQNIHTDTYTFVYQYAKLIPYLSNNNMNTDIKEEFYEFLSQNKAKKRVFLIDWSLYKTILLFLTVSTLRF